METIEEMIIAAMERKAARGIDGWGLRVPDDLPGTVVETRAAVGCTSETCGHNSHDPAAPDRKWLPPADSTLVVLDEEHEANETLVRYYVLRRPGQPDTALRATWPRSFWAGVERIALEAIPDWALLTLAAN